MDAYVHTNLTVAESHSLGSWYGCEGYLCDPHKIHNWPDGGGTSIELQSIFFSSSLKHSAGNHSEVLF